MKLERNDEKRLAVLSAELSTIRLDGSCVMEAVLSELREILDTETVLLYSVGEQLDGWQLTRWHQAGGDPKCGVLLGQAVRQESATSVFYYDALRPAKAQRNRVVDASVWIDRDSPGTWESSRMCREVLEPLDMHRYSQPRALVCDGPSLLAWFGALNPGAATRRQMLVIAALIPAMRQRLTLERQLEEAPRTGSALRAALEHLGTAAFVIGAQGTIHETNAAGRTWLDKNRLEIARALEDAVAGRSNDLEVDLVPLVDGGLAAQFLAIVRMDPLEGRIALCVQSCTSQWGLTARQGEVLALVSRGLANATIAGTMRLGERSIELHMTAIFDRAGVDSRAALVARVLTSNWGRL